MRCGWSWRGRCPVSRRCGCSLLRRIGWGVVTRLRKLGALLVAVGLLAVGVIPPADAAQVPARVGAVAWGQVLSGTYTPTFSQTPIVGDVLVLAISDTDAAALVPTTPTGWTAAVSRDYNYSGSNHQGLFVYWRVATGTGDAPGTFATAVSGGGTVARLGTWFVEEYSGLSGHDADSTSSTSAASSGTVTWPTVTTTAPNDYVLHIWGSSNSGLQLTAWGGGSAQDIAPSGAGTGRILVQGVTYADTVSTYTATTTVSNSAYSSFGSVAFKRSADAAGATVATCSTCLAGMNPQAAIALLVVALVVGLGLGVFGAVVT